MYFFFFFQERTVSFDIAECQQNKFFCNKIWQASRYVVLMTSDDPIEIPKNFTVIDQWILSRLGWMIETVNNALDQKNFYKAVTAIKEFIYYEYCDYYVVRFYFVLSQEYSLVNLNNFILHIFLRKEQNQDSRVNNKILLSVTDIH